MQRSVGDGSTAGGAQVTHTYAAAGTYLAVVTASNSVSMLTATTTVLVVAGEIPIAGLTATSNSPTIVGYVTSLSAQVTAGTNISYTWNLGDGTTAGGAQVAHVYPAPGIYAAVVTASNNVPATWWAGRALPPGQSTLAGFAFLKPVTITIHYSDEDVAGLDENTLRLLYRDGTAWHDTANTCTPPSAYFRDLEANILSVAVCHLTEFAMVGQ